MGDAEPLQEATPALPDLDWQRIIADALAARGVTVAAYVPDTRLQGILRALAGHRVRMRSLTREEECVGYAAGQRIAGGRPVVLMQSSGLGNALNALGSLAVPYRLGIPLVVSMRGTLGEANPSQIPPRATARTCISAHRWARRWRPRWASPRRCPAGWSSRCSGTASCSWAPARCGQWRRTGRLT